LVRGVSGAELLQALVKASAADRLVLLHSDKESLYLEQELTSLSLPIQGVISSPLARSHSKHQRAIQRTRIWDSYLKNAHEITLDLNQLSLLGTPPPIEHPEI
jgi:polynucleotide 5'-kinase involved in rRNA processing